MGRASSLAAANAVSLSALRRTFWATRVVGRSPAVWIAGNSSASMPLMWVSKRPLRRWSDSPAVSSRSTLSPAGSELTRSVSSLAGTVVAPSVSILPGHPVGDPDLEVRRRQLEPGVLGLQEDVGQDGQGAAARDGAADDGQAAGQVLLHDRESHVGFTPRAVGGSGTGWARSTRWRTVRRPRRSLGRSPGRAVRVGRGYLLSIFSLRHHHHQGVDRGGRRLVAVRGRDVDDAGPDGGRAGVRPGMARCAGAWTTPSGRPQRASRGPRGCAHRTVAGCPQPGRVFHGFRAVIHTNRPEKAAGIGRALRPRGQSA